MSATTRRHRAGARAGRPSPPVLSHDEFPELTAFLRGYLHEDYLAEYGSAEAARDVFLADASPDERHALAEECRRFLGAVAGQPVAAVRRVLAHDLGCGWQPRRATDVGALFAPVMTGPSDRRDRR